MQVPSRPKIAALADPKYVEWLVRLFRMAELVSITHRIKACRDSKDDKFLELAVNGKADFILSGDVDLLAMTPFQNIPIISPALFVSARP